MNFADEGPWSAAKAKASFWRWFTIDLSVVCLVTYVFDLSTVWLPFFVVVPLFLRKRVIAFMMAPRKAPMGQARRNTEIDEAVTALKEGLTNSLKPQGAIKSAASGARLRDRVLSLIDKVESETGEQAVIVAADGVLTDPKLHDEIQKQPDSAALELAVLLCFPMPEAALYLNPLWPSKIVKYHGLKNTDEILFEKSSVLATFVTHNLGLGIEVYTQIENRPPQLSDEEQLIVRLEEAACWYRVIDELAYLHIRERRPLFADLFVDSLVEILALQGTPPDLVCQTMAVRSQEYSQYREWVSTDTSAAATLLWNGAKHVGESLGTSRNPLFLTLFGNCFLTRVNEAFVYELLTGRESRKQTS